MFEFSEERLIFTVGTVAAHSVTFWTLNALLYVCYTRGYFKQYRIQDKLPDENLSWKCFINCLISHFIVGPIAAYLMFPRFKAYGMTIDGPLPSAAIIIRDILIAVAFNDTFFYWSHRLLHHKAIYKFIHKKHHTFKQNIGIASEFAHPVEDLCNIFATVGGCLFMGSHAYVLWLWLVIRIAETVDAHSGYLFPWSPFSLFSVQGGAERHEFHHSHNVGNFGSFFIFWDWLMGTDVDYLAYKAKIAKENAKSK